MKRLLFALLFLIFCAAGSGCAVVSSTLLTKEDQLNHAGQYEELLDQLKISASEQKCQSMIYNGLKSMRSGVKPNRYDLIMYEFYCAHYRIYALIETGRFDKAERLCQEAIKNLEELLSLIRQSGDPLKDNTRKILSWLRVYQGFIVWFKTGDQTKAIRILEDIKTESLSKKGLIYVYLYRGFFYDKILGKYDAAMECFEKVVKVSSELGLTDTDARYAYALQAYRRMMLIDMKLGRLDAAKNVLSRYEELSEEVLFKTGKFMMGRTEYFRGYLCMIDTNVGMLYSLMRDFKAAEKYFDNARKVIQQIDPASKLMWDKNARGSYYVMYGTYFLGLQNRFREAAEYIDRGIGYLTPYYIESIATEIDIETAYMNAAEIYYSLGDKEKALERLEKSIQYADRYHRKVIASQAFTLKGKIYFDQKQYKKAGGAYEKALALISNVESSENWKLYYYLGLLEQTEGRTEKALYYYRKSVEEVEKLWDGRFKDVRRQLSFMENRLVVFEPAIDLMVQKTQFSNAVGYMEKAKSRSFYETTSFFRRESETGLHGAPMSASEIRKFIPGDMVVIEYYVGREVVIGCLMTRDRIYAKCLNINAGNLGKYVTEMRNAITGMENYAGAAVKLYQAIVEPFESRMKGFKRVCIIPHGVLNYLPFQALVTDRSKKGKVSTTTASLQRAIQVVARQPENFCYQEDTRFLIERYGIFYAPSATILKMVHQTNRSQKGRMLAVGSPPQTELEGIGKIPKLQFAEAEVRDVGGLFRDKLLLVDAQATETAVKNNMQNYDMMLFSTHAIMMRTDPFQSFILFEKDSENDGRLTVSELEQTKLNADLVVLSACESGIMSGHQGFTAQTLADEKFPPGDDIFGFQRTLLQAGIGSVISTLWSVDDESTRELMVRFFEAYLRQDKIDKAMALRNAQMYLIQKKGEWTHPYYWAPFCISGDWM